MNRIELPSVPVGADKAALGPDAGNRSLGAALSGAEGGPLPQRVKKVPSALRQSEGWQFKVL